ncbi:MULTISPECIES: hypothetical protein [Streptomycetaceae]|uniref:Uncharacterized protein n=1 Tax=Streptantibioticus cattleyicolor (strain ATCC 35852 / DSM 46488 / JCM 4925 / NBRC 14057 / NRRL 8057) TaxID=1003195 RepID=F8JUV3_STREN
MAERSVLRSHQQTPLPLDISDLSRAVNGANTPVDGGRNAPSAHGY